MFYINTLSYYKPKKVHELDIALYNYVKLFKAQLIYLTKIE